MMQRRTFLKGAAGAVAASALARELLAAGSDCRLSACDWSLKAKGPGGLEIAKRCTLDGLEISPGKIGDAVELADPAYRGQYKDAAAKTGVTVSSTAMGCLNQHPLASEPRAPAWLEQMVDATADLGCKVMLLAFFGKGDLRAKGGDLKTKDVDVVVERLKAAAKRAEKAGVVLGLENTLSAKQNVQICDRVGSSAVQVYYDIGNSWAFGYDVPAEIRWLGTDRICQFHFKDRKHGYLGQGQVKMKPVAEAIAAIGYKGWIVLETRCPSKDRDADFRKNAAYVRDLMGMKA